MRRQNIWLVEWEWLNKFLDFPSLPGNTDVKGYPPNYMTYISLLCSHACLGL